MNLKSEEAYSMIREIGNEKNKKISKKPLKVVASVAIISAITITTTFAAGYIIDYFNKNKDSLYLSDKNDFEETGTSLNLTMKDKGIELTIDDNYMVIFHTVKTDENIKQISSDYEDAYFANPIIDAYVNDEIIIDHKGEIEHEATYVSNNELKGMRKIDISNVDLDKNEEITLGVKNIFGVKGNWETKVKVKELKDIKEDYTYNIDKDYTIIQEYDNVGENVKVKHNINIEKISISPLASKIFINEKPSVSFGEWIPTILKLEGYKNDISKIRSIKKVSTYSKSDMKLLHDQKIEIDLTKQY